MRVRRPVVSGIFYPSGRDELVESIRECFSHGPNVSVEPKSSDERKGTREGRVTAVVSPHAAYMYSGSVAAYSYYHAYKHAEPDTIIMVGPNHYGLGSGIASMKDYYWETPLGMVRVDDATVDGIVRYSGIVDIDSYAHSRDHCLEVQLPMLQYIYDYEFTIVPIVIWIQDKSTAVELGRAIAEVSKDIIREGKEVLLIASSDLTHYEPHEQAVRKDSELIDAMKDLDINRYYTVLERLNISACGYGAIASIMEACRSLGFSKGILLKYATSGDITEDRSSVVGYPSVAFI
jgi:AmmeMemoRadiSam system protein B